jgi:prolipoprotein diacylglyceryltransferase
MQDLIFVATLGAVLLGISIRAFLRLPRKDGQMLAAIPIQPCGTAVWNGLNLTGYGLYNALAYTLAAAMSFLLLGAIRIPAGTATLVFFALAAICVPASSFMARIVEGKRHTLTVGGASFIGILLAPWIVLLASWIAQRTDAAELPIKAILAAFAIAYTFGEGFGRLACISFGCCYGRPIESLSPRLQHWFAPIAFRFNGYTRKIAYAGNLENVPVVPIQAFTNILYICTGMLSLALFLNAHFVAACLTSLFVTQAWRIASEYLRADFRGTLAFSAYQRMSLVSMPYIAIVLIMLPTHGAPLVPQLGAGFQTLWHPAIILALQALFVFALIYTGRSSVTGSTIKFYVHKDRI